MDQPKKLVERLSIPKIEAKIDWLDLEKSIEEIKELYKNLTPDQAEIRIIDNTEVDRSLPWSCKTPNQCLTCPVSYIERCGLIWIGEKFYPSIPAFTKESDRLGISRRIFSIPRGFELGKTWVALAHRKGIPTGQTEPNWTPAIFTVFKPTAIEVICDGSESPTYIDNLIKRGLTPIKVEKIENQQTFC